MGLVNGIVPLLILAVGEWRAPAIKTLDEFFWKRHFCILCGALMVFASMRLVGVAAGVTLVALIQARAPFALMMGRQLLPLLTAVMLLFLGVPLFYVSGRLMGRRSNMLVTMPKGLLDVSFAVLLGFLISEGFTLFFLGREEWSSQMQSTVEASAAPFLASFSVGFLFVLIPPLLGYWRGRRQNIGVYTSYVIKRTPTDARILIAEFVHDKATDAVRQATEVNPAPGGNSLPAARSRHTEETS